LLVHGRRTLYPPLYALAFRILQADPQVYADFYEQSALRRNAMAQVCFPPPQ